MAPAVLGVESLALASLGFGTSYTLADSLGANIGTFMRQLPGSLALPNQIMLWCSICAGATLLAAWTPICGGGPTLLGFQRLAWCLLTVQIAGAVLAAVAWRLVLLETAVMVIASACIGTVVGTLSVTSLIPGLGVFYREELTASYFTGSAIGSLIAGLLGLVQARWPAYGPCPYMLTIGALLCCGLLGWMHSEKNGLGLKDGSKEIATSSHDGAAEPEKAKPAPGLESTRLLPGSAVEEGLCGLSGHGCCGLAPLLLLVLPLNMATWGLAPNVLQFAAAHAGCSCDADAAAVYVTYQLATSLSFVAMALAGVLSFVHPARKLQSLYLAGGLQWACVAVILCGAAPVAPLRCSAGARWLLVLASVGMRSGDTYTTACAYRLLASAFGHDPPLHARTALVLGRLLALGTTAASIAAAVASRHGLVGCRLD